MDLKPQKVSHRVIPDDLQLLELIAKDGSSSIGIYKPGPYWENKANSALIQLRKLGLSAFRTGTNSALTSFGDNPNLNVTNISSSLIKLRLKKIICSTPPFKKMFYEQLALTREHYLASIKAINDYYKQNARTKSLLEKYKIDFHTIIGGSEAYLEHNDVPIAHIYLKLLDTLDQINSRVNLETIKSYFEIGGGFGINVELLINFFPNVKKIVYLDIAPNLYIGTQYLKAKFGDAVVDYRACKDLEEINFKEDESLEIYCILPSQIERLNCKFDFVHNSHSFVEMTENIVKNYATNIQRLLNEDLGKIYLVTYDGFDSLTIHPQVLANIFNLGMKIEEVPTLLLDRIDYHIYFDPKQ